MSWFNSFCLSMFFTWFLQKDVNLNEDALLGDIMAELHDSSASAMPAPIKLKKKAPSK